MSASETQIGKDLYEFGSFRVDPAKQLLLHEAEPVLKSTPLVHQSNRIPPEVAKSFIDELM